MEMKIRGEKFERMETRARLTRHQSRVWSLDLGEDLKMWRYRSEDKRKEEADKSTGTIHGDKINSSIVGVPRHRKLWNIDKKTNITYNEQQQDLSSLLHRINGSLKTGNNICKVLKENNCQHKISAMTISFKSKDGKGFGFLVRSSSSLRQTSLPAKNS